MARWQVEREGGKAASCTVLQLQLPSRMPARTHSHAGLDPEPSCSQLLHHTPVEV